MHFPLCFHSPPGGGHANAALLFACPHLFLCSSRMGPVTAAHPYGSLSLVSLLATPGLTLLLSRTLLGVLVFGRSPLLWPHYCYVVGAFFFSRPLVGPATAAPSLLLACLRPPFSPLGSLLRALLGLPRACALRWVSSSPFPCSSTLFSLAVVLSSTPSSLFPLSFRCSSLRDGPSFPFSPSFPPFLADSGMGGGPGRGRLFNRGTWCTLCFSLLRSRPDTPSFHVFPPSFLFLSFFFGGLPPFFPRGSARSCLLLFFFFRRHPFFPGDPLFLAFPDFAFLRLLSPCRDFPFLLFILTF